MELEETDMETTDVKLYDFKLEDLKLRKGKLLINDKEQEHSDSEKSPTGMNKKDCRILEMNPFVLGMKKPPRTDGLEEHERESYEAEIKELRNEISDICREKNEQESKLSSSLRSIKTFWSPELKKERSKRKEEGNRYKDTKERLDAVLEELEEKSSTMEILKQELMNIKNSQDVKHSKIVIEQEEEIRDSIERIRELECINRNQDEDINLLQSSLLELSTKLNTTIESQHQIILVKDEAIESCTMQVEQLQKLADQQSDEIYVMKNKLEGCQASADNDIKKILAKEEKVKTAEKEIKLLQDQNKKLEDKICILEHRLEEKNEQALKEMKTLESMAENKNAEIQAAEHDSEEREKRISLLEDALRESVCIAAEREDLLSQHINLSDEASARLQEHEAMVDQFTMEKHITNIKNAFLILALSEKDATIKALREATKIANDIYFNWRQNALLSSISDKDSCIALFEMQNPSETQKKEIQALCHDKDCLLKQLKQQAQSQYPSREEEEIAAVDMLHTEMKEAPAETIFNTTRILIDGYEKLEYYVEQLLKFFKVKEVEVFEDHPELPPRNALIVRKPDFASREELLEDLTDVACDTRALRHYADDLLSKLEED